MNEELNINLLVANMDVLTRVSVDYETLPGWQCCTEAARSFEELPSQAQNYVRFIEDFLQVPGLYRDILMEKHQPNHYRLRQNLPVIYVCLFPEFSEVGWSRQVQRKYDQAVLR